MRHPTLQERVSVLVDAIESPRGESRRIDYWTLVYTTTGGSRMIASTPETNDDGRAHDLVLVHPAALNGDHMVVLRPTVDPEWATALAVELARRRWASGGMTWSEQERARAGQEG